MLAALATSAGHPGRTNEDFVGAVPGAVVLLDGAGIPGVESLCRHGVAWYTHLLGGSLLGRLSGGGAPSLVSVLADAIDQLAGEHRVARPAAGIGGGRGHLRDLRSRALTNHLTNEIAEDPLPAIRC